MLIDFHTHAFADSLAPRAIASLSAASGGLTPCTDGTASDLIRSMDECGVAHSVMLNIATKPKQQIRINDWAAEISSNRITAFGSIHPDADDVFDELERIKSLGLKGIKLHPEYQNFVVDTPEMLRIYDYAFSKGLMILFHAGYDPAFAPPYKSSPKQFAKIKKELKGGTIIAAHLGSAKMWEDVEKYLAGTDIYIDTSMGFEYYPHDLFLRIVRAVGEDRVLFGSDSPWSNAGREIETLNSLALSQQTKENILYKNAQKLLKL